jgi:hypothetical protein
MKGAAEKGSHTIKIRRASLPDRASWGALKNLDLKQIASMIEQRAAVGKVPIRPICPKKPAE